MLPVRFPRCLHLEKTQYEQSSPVFAFTLIELLIVIAIILILVSIALPNFLDAQVRAKVTRAKGEIRGLATALEQYHGDYNYYPRDQDSGAMGRNGGLCWMTTPTSYIHSVPQDSFGSHEDEPWEVYQLGGIETFGRPCLKCLETWVLFSNGPDLRQSELGVQGAHFDSPSNDGSSDSYCPTNGTRSIGDIFLWGGDPFWIGVNLKKAELQTYRMRPAEKGKVVDNVRYLHSLPPSLR